MANVCKTIAQAAFPTSVATIYTTPDATTTLIKEILLCNCISSSAYIWIYFVPPAGSTNVASAIIYSSPLLPGETQTWELSTFLSAGYTIQIQSDTDNAVGITVSGVEMG